MSGRRQGIAAARLRGAQLDKLRANDLIDLEHGLYRASEITLYSGYQLSARPLPATDKRAGRSTDISWESH